MIIIDNTWAQVKLIEETFLVFIYQLVMASAGMRVVSCLVIGKKRVNQLSAGMELATTLFVTWL